MASARKYQRLFCEHCSCTLSKSTWYDHQSKFHCQKRGVTTYSETSDSEDEDIGNGSSVGSKVCK